MKVFGLIIALLLSISCSGGSIKVDYKSIIDKYQYVNEILEMTNQEVSDKDDKIYQYILSKEQGKKHIDTFFEEIKVKESKENQFLIFSRLLLQINRVNQYDISNINEDNNIIEKINSILNNEFLNESNQEKYEKILNDNFTDEEIFLLFRSIYYNPEFNIYEKGEERSKIERIQKIREKIKDAFPLIETDNENYNEDLQKYEKNERSYIRNSISKYMKNKINYGDRLSSLVHISADNKILIMSTPYDPFGETKTVKYAEIKIKNYKKVKFKLYKNTLYIDDSGDIYSIYLDGEGKSEIQKIK